MRRSIQTEKWNGEGENMKQGKENKKNYKTTNRKTGITIKNKQDNHIQYYLMFYRLGHDQFLTLRVVLTMRVSRTHRHCEHRYCAGLGSQIFSSVRSFDSHSVTKSENLQGPAQLLYPSGAVKHVRST